MINISYFKSQFGNNWGDFLNQTLIEKLSCKSVNWVDFGDPSEKMMAIGSILSFSTPFTTVWGSGFLRSSEYLTYIPKSVIAVRGPLSSKILKEKHNISCNLYGDPAYLYSEFYNPDFSKKYKLGIIPHYIDLPLFNGTLPDCKIINILDPIDKVIDEVLQCESIISSSLHGLIIAHMYKIPFRWVEFSKNVVGDGFKFKDWMESCRFNQDVLQINSLDSKVLDKICNSTFLPDINLDLKLLKESFPY